MLQGVQKFIRVVRSDRQGQARISGRKIYILPTRYGLLFGLMLVLLLIGSINYANSPAFLLTFLLTGLFFHTIFHTWRNLLDLQIRWLGANPVFAGKPADFQFQLTDPEQRDHAAIQLAFGAGDPAISDIGPGADQQLTLRETAPRRGWFRPGRVTVETRYPLGLLRAWSYLDTDARVLVYPKPAERGPAIDAPEYEGTLAGDRGSGTDDFVGHRGYHPGDQPRHMNWKAFAADKGLLIKQFGGDRMNRIWLDFSGLEMADTEQRLQLLTRAILDLSQGQEQFGLRLPGQEIQPGSGQAHVQQCLRALALYGIE